MSEPTRVGTPDGTVLAVRQLPGVGGLLVILHGFTGDSSAMWTLAEHVRGDGPVLLVDLIGHGSSDAPTELEPYSMSSVVDQVLSLIGHQEPGTVHLLGYSMGGRIALSMAARAPWYFASVISVSSMAGIEDPAERAARRMRDHELADHAEAIGVDAFVDEWMSIPLFAPMRTSLTSEALENSRLQRRRSSVTGLANSLRGTGTGSMPPVGRALEGLRSPLLAVAGELDPVYMTHARGLAARVPTGHFAPIPGAGHALPLENPRGVAAAVSEFLEGLAQP